jgi:hypothetical protein
MRRASAEAWGVLLMRNVDFANHRSSAIVAVIVTRKQSYVPGQVPFRSPSLHRKRNNPDVKRLI